MLFRFPFDVAVAAGRKVQSWVRCSGTKEGHVADSIVHRYDFEVGFSTPSSAEEDSNPQIKAANRRLRQLGIGQIPSHAQRVTKWALFERFVLTHNGAHDWAVWLLSVRALIGTEEPASAQVLDELARTRVKFVAPPEGLVKQYIDALRFGTINADQMPAPDAKPEHKGGTIRVYVSAIGATCKEFDAVDPTKTDLVKNIVKGFINEDGYDQTAAFNVVEHMPRLYNSCWSMVGWGMERMLMCWTMFLVAMVLMGRACDLTTYCPTYEDLRLPPEDEWDNDGYPQYIDIGLRDWKWRRARNKGSRYSIKAHRNYLDGRFCPVFWLMMWLDHSKIKSGPIFQLRDKGEFKGNIMNPDVWVGMTNRLFADTGLYDPKGAEEFDDDDGVIGHSKGCTNHAIRKTACQWAGRCDANPLDVKNAGRWKSYEQMSEYHSQGAAKRRKNTRNGARDPIRRVWVWKPTCEAGVDGKNQM